MTIERFEPSSAATRSGCCAPSSTTSAPRSGSRRANSPTSKLAQTLPPSDLTLGGMLKHLAFVEDYWFSYHLAANDPAPPWDAALAESPDLGRPVARPRPAEKGEAATVRWVLVHMVEEYARHAGHADLIRQSIDGATQV